MSVCHLDPRVVSVGEDLGGVSVLREAFAGVVDPRQARGIRYEVVSVLMVAVLAALTGAGNFRELGDRTRELSQQVLAVCGARFHPGLGIYQAPSSATIRRVTQAVDAPVLDKAITAWLRARIWAKRAADARQAGESDGISAGQWTSSESLWCSGFGPIKGLDALAVDGKVVRNSGGPDGVDVKLFSALLHKEQVVIAQIAIPEGTNEITCVRALLDDLDITSIVVTADAAHTQDDTATYLKIERGGEYVMTVKGNRPKLMNAIAGRMPAAKDGSADHEDTEIVNGLRVVREIWTTTAEGIDFPGAAQVFRIRRRVFEPTGACISKEIVHGITSLTRDKATPEDLATLVRNHWRVESNHWLRDTAYREDDQQAYTANSAHAMAALRNLALGILRLSGTTRIQATLQKHAADHTKITQLLAQITNPDAKIN